MEDFLDWYVNRCNAVHYLTNTQFDNIQNTYYTNDSI